MTLSPTEAARLKLVLTAAVDAVSLGGPPSTPATPSPSLALQGVDTSGWTQTFSETWNTLDLNRWNPVYAQNSRLGNGCSLPSNNEDQWYINDLYAPTDAVRPWSVANNILTLTADHMPPAIKPLCGYAQLPGNMGSYGYTSGQLNSRNSFSQAYGYFEATMRLPAGQGLWPAFWLLPQDMSWPPEIDVLEVLGQEPNRIYSTLHMPGINPSPHLEEWVDTSMFHRIGLRWRPDGITTWIDGKQAADNGIITGLIPSIPMYLLFDLAVGKAGSWPGPPNAATVFPARFDIGAVSVWKEPGL
jgi:beta-glucanase (GH16 family)